MILFNSFRTLFPSLFILYLFSFYVQLTVNRYLPFGIMGGLSLVTALLCLTLPETRNKPTMEDLHPQHEKDEHIEAEKSNLITNETKI